MLSRVLILMDFVVVRFVVPAGRSRFEVRGGGRFLSSGLNPCTGAVSAVEPISISIISYWTCHICRLDILGRITLLGLYFTENGVEALGRG